jgi:protein-S-isoprenylcysteine O-methyltransferase Ste14
MDFFARWRVRIGYFLAVLVLWLARPAPKWILVGGAVGLLGLAIRAYSAGYLHKQEVLTVSGPYAYTRNPLYFGSSILTAGAAIAMHSVWSAAVLLIYFALVYSLVMRREEMELRRKHGAAFDEYAKSVPLFFPRFTTTDPGQSQMRPPQKTAATNDATLPSIQSESGAFSWARYKKNHEYEAFGGFLLLLVALVVIWRLRGT